MRLKLKAHPLLDHRRKGKKEGVKESRLRGFQRHGLVSWSATGKITSLEEIFESGQRIKESEIVKKLLPDIKSNVVSVGIVQKQTDAGEITKFAAVVAVGNEAGWFGVGRGKAVQMRSAIHESY